MNREPDVYHGCRKDGNENETKGARTVHIKPRQLAKDVASSNSSGGKTQKQYEATSCGPRHSRVRKSLNLGDYARDKPMAFTPWVSKDDQGLDAVKVCSPVISRVNAHGFLPSFDGAGDVPNSAGPNDKYVTLVNLGDSHIGSTDNARENHQWYEKTPREKPHPAEVRRFFRQIAEEERQMIYKYRLQDLGDHERIE
jgi:hypothetical protein